MRYVMGIMLLVAHVSLQAEETVSDWYQVEIILFAQINPLATDEQNRSRPSYPSKVIRLSAPGDSTFTPSAELDNVDFPGGILSQSQPASLPPIDTLETEAEMSLNLEGIALETELTQTLPVDQPRAFRLLGKDEKLLNSVASNIRRSRGYRFISHTAWRLPVVSEATPILIQAGNLVGDQFEIDGYITISKSRYLHLKTHLWFNEFTSSADQISTTDTQVFNNPSNSAYQATRIHKMQQSRKMLSKTLHYIDHPYFGLLISMTPHTPEPSAGLDIEPSADLNREPSAGLNKEPSADFNQEPSADLVNAAETPSENRQQQARKALSTSEPKLQTPAN